MKVAAAVALVSALATPASAETPSFSATFESDRHAMPHARVMHTDAGPALILSEVPRTCADPFFPVIVPLEVGNGRARGRIDVGPGGGVAGSGTFDAVICAKPVQ
jgi:hypothetical protein